MPEHLSPRLMAIVNALPLRDGMRVLEIGCGPGAAAREVARRIGGGHVLGLDRSSKAVTQAKAASAELINAGVLLFRQGDIETFTLTDDEQPFDLAFAARVGALDGRHPEVERPALACITAALTPTGRLFIDGGDPLREVDLRR